MRTRMLLQWTVRSAVLCKDLKSIKECILFQAGVLPAECLFISNCRVDGLPL